MEIDIKSAHGLIPAIIQDSETKNVLMLGYMNEESLQKTIETQKVTFFSRSKQRLWTKGEESGNFLNLVSIGNVSLPECLLNSPIYKYLSVNCFLCDWKSANTAGIFVLASAI